MSEFNDFTMAFQDSADQVPLLLIHGFPLDSTLWELQFQGLEDMARIIAPDLRGHGRSDNPPGPYSMEMFADDINGLLDHLGVYRPVILCGLSMGGYVVFEFYRRYPERVAGIILTAAGLGFLGLGAQPPMPEWGAMISEGRKFLIDHWWVAAMPGLAIFTVSMGFNLLGDGLRDALDPKSGK